MFREKEPAATVPSDDAWHEIRRLVDEAAQLSKTCTARGEFYTELLQRVVTALAAIGGVVWTLQGGNRFLLETQINLDRSRLLETETSQQAHLQLLNELLRKKEGMLFPPRSGGAGDGALSNPSDLLLIASPVLMEDGIPAVIEVFQRPDTRPAAQQGFLRFLARMCELAADFHRNQNLRELRERQTLWAEFETFAQAAHRGLNIQETAFTLSNEGRRLIDCDRVSVAVRYGNYYRLEAVSGQDTLNRRSNTVRSLQNLIYTVARTGESMWYAGDTLNLPPQIEKVLQPYLDESHARVVAVIPLNEPLKHEPTSEDDTGRKKRMPIIGALVVEQFDSTRLDETTWKRIEAVRDHSALALNNAIEHHQVFLLPLWLFLGRLTWFLHGRMLPKTLLGLAGLIAAIFCLVFVQMDFEIEARGTLQPTTRRDVYAPLEGEVTQINVRHGQEVTGKLEELDSNGAQKATLLVQLSNKELDKQLSSVEGDINVEVSKLNSVQALIRQGPGPGRDPSQLAADAETSKKHLESLYQQRTLLLDQQKELAVYSPISGEVTTWDVENVLTARPVQQGNYLMTVAQLSGEWELEVYMPEDRMGHVLQAPRNDQKQLDLPVSFILATDPEVYYRGRIDPARVSLAAEVQEEYGNCVRLIVKIDKRQLPALRPGAGVSAKVFCGRRSVGFVYFHPVWEFIQSRIFWRIF